jgi:hypothetical protein
MIMATEGRVGKVNPRDWPSVLRRLLPPELWRSFQGRVPAGGDPRTHWLGRWVVLCWALMGWAGCPGLVERFATSRAALVALHPSRRRPGRSFQGLVKAGQRLKASAFYAFWGCLRGYFAAWLGVGWNWCGWIVFGVDGSRVEAPRTRANEKKLGRAGRAKSGPQWWVTTLVHLPSRLLWAWRQGPGTASERGHLWQMLGELPPRALLLADAGFVGFALLRALQERGTDFLIRCGGNVRLLLADTRQQWERCGSSRIVYLWPQGRRRVRPLRLRLVTLKRGGKAIYLLTSVLEPERLPARLAGEFYAARWELEVNFRSLKQTLERRRLLARTPRTGELELAGNVVALGLLLAHAAWLLRGAAPRASVAGLLRVVRRAIAALVWGRGSPWFCRQARVARRDEYRRRRSKRARDWPHQKNEPPAGPPKLRRLTRPERAAITRWNQTCPTEDG